MINLFRRLAVASPLDATFRKFLEEVVTSGLDFVGHPYQLDQRDTCSLCITLALCACDNFLCYRTLRCCVANALIYGSKTIARYPVREAVGLVDI